MNAAERRRILGDDVIADIDRQVAEAPEASPDLIEDLRRILTRPAGRSPQVHERPQRAA